MCALLLAGCHAQTQKSKPQLVYANLDVLVHDNPEWNGLGLYDQMMGKLQQSTQQAEVSLSQPVPALNISGLSGLNLPGGAFALPASTLQQQRTLLAQLLQTQIKRLRLRQMQVRHQTLAAQTRVWRLAAEQQYIRDVAAAQARYSQDYGVALAKDNQHRLNLELQIKSLTQTIAHWKLSAPPAPRLVQDRQELAAKQAHLAFLQTQQTGQLAQLTDERTRALAQASHNKTLSVQRQSTQLMTRLRAQDQTAYLTQEALLKRQAGLLLGRERSLAAAAVPTAGTLGPVSLSGPKSLMPPVGGLRQAEAKLTAQRARWSIDLYDSTRAAAIDAARGRHWKVTFDQSAGCPDRTTQIAALLAKDIWNS